MHNIKDIRKNPESFQKSLSKRFVNIDIKNILDLDEKNRKLIQEKETLEKQKKDISKSKDEAMFQKSKEISSKIKELTQYQSKVKKELIGNSFVISNPKATSSCGCGLSFSV